MGAAHNSAKFGHIVAENNVVNGVVIDKLAHEILGRYDGLMSRHDQPLPKDARRNLASRVVLKLAALGYKKAGADEDIVTQAQDLYVAARHTLAKCLPLAQFNR